MAKADIGLIGLAVTGENLILHMESKGFTVACFNRTVSKVDNFVNGWAEGKDIIGRKSVEELCASLKPTRKVTLMVKAGSAVDAFIDKLLPHLEDDNIIIDGGNLHFPDTIHRRHGRWGTVGNKYAYTEQYRQSHRNQMMADLMGKETGYYCNDRGGFMHVAGVEKNNNFGSIGTVGSNRPPDVGRAFADEKCKIIRKVVLLFYDDGSTNCSSFHKLTKECQPKYCDNGPQKGKKPPVKKRKRRRFRKIKDLAKLFMEGFQVSYETNTNKVTKTKLSFGGRKKDSDD